MNAPEVLETEISSSDIYLQQESPMLVGNATNFSSRERDSISADSLPSENLSGVDLECFPSHPGNSNFFSNQYRQHTLSVPHRQSSTFLLQNGSSRPYIVHTAFDPDDLASSSSTGIGGVRVHQYSNSNDFLDTSRGSFKRKNDEASFANGYSLSASTSSSLVDACTNWYHPQPDNSSGSVGGACDPLALFQSGNRGNNRIPASGSSQRSVRSRSSSMRMCTNRAMAFNFNNQFHGGNQIGQCPPTDGSDGTLTPFSNHSDGTGSNWNCIPVPSGLHETLASSAYTGPQTNEGPTEVENRLMPAYPPVFGRIPAVRWHAPPMLHLHPQSTHPILHGDVPALPNREAVFGRLYQNIQSRSHDSMQLGPSRYFQVVPMQQVGIRSSRSQRRFSFEQAPSFTRDNNHMRLAMISSQNFAMLDYSGFYDSGGYEDEYRDMRLDIEDMSYEDLLALGERIGDVNTGLSEESISKFLKTQNNIPCTCSSTCNNCENHTIKNGNCIICQEEYKAEEEVGSLDCGHEFHTACVRQWLLIKNLCPICKTHALATDEK